MRDFSHCKRIVLKAGTSILTSPSGHFSKRKLSQLASELLRMMHQQKIEPVLVSSGAIGLGMDAKGLKKRPQKMSMLQACAAIGQGQLIHAYEKFFSAKGLLTAQILLTRDGLENRDRFLNARRTFEELLAMKVLPIVNENDTVATDEIRFGDNDILSVQVGHLVHADLVIILSDVDGFFLKDGSRLRQVTAVDEIDRELVKHLKKTKTEKTVGGMESKLEAARIAMRLGLPFLLVNGHCPEILLRALQGEDVGTLFMAEKAHKNARKKWIAFSAARHGAVMVDQGAYDALRLGNRSLLASGILKVHGRFNRREVVELQTPSGKVFGRGIVRYSCDDLALVSGKKSHEVKSILQDRYQGEVIHCDDLVIWG